MANINTVYTFLATLTVKELYNFCMDLGLDNYAIVSLMGKVASIPAPPVPSTTFLLEGTGPSPKKIQAIKAVRTFTGWGLKEAKDVIDTSTLTLPKTIVLYDGKWYDFVDEMISCGYYVNWERETF